MTKTCLLDYDSIAGADKFGNIFVLRVPADVSDDVDNPTGAYHAGGVVIASKMSLEFSTALKKGAYFQPRVPKSPCPVRRSESPKEKKKRNSRAPFFFAPFLLLTSTHSCTRL